MKKVLIFLALLLPSIVINGQNTAVYFDVNYNGSSYKFDLLIGESLSLWQDKTEYENNPQTPSFLVKNYTKGKLLLKEEIFGQEFYVEDSLYNIKWELQKNTKVVLGQKCNSAKTSFRGRNYIAYYAPNLHNTDGPWKFGGLPGLILEVSSDDNTYQFIATKLVKNYDKKIETPNLTKYKFIGWSEFVKKFNTTIENHIKLARSNGTISDDSQVNIKIDAPEIIYKKAQEKTGANF